MARYVVRLAKNAGIVVLFVLAALLGTVSGVLFAFVGDLPADLRARRLLPEHHHARLARDGDVVGEFADAAARGRPLRDDLAEAPARHLRGRGRRLRAARRPERAHIILAATRDGVEAGRDAVTGTHSRPAARARSPSSSPGALPRRGRLRDRRHQPERKIKEAIVAIQIEKRYTKHEIFTILRQPDATRARRLRRRGRVAAVLREAGEGPDPRRGRD